jgi:hypothetical protein
MKAIGTFFIILALVIGIVPQFTDCLAQGKTIALPNGKTIPMKCHWTRQAEVAVAIPLGLVGILTFSSKRRETRRVLSGLGLSLGLVAILLPTTLIGVCASQEMMCNMVMKPTLIFAGALTMATGLVGLVYLRGPDLEAGAAAETWPVP